MSIQQDNFKAIADKIREKTGETDLIKPSDFASKIEDVYVAGQNAGGGGGSYEQGFKDGKQAERDAFWESLQKGGARSDYTYAFMNWSDDIYNPKYPLEGALNQCLASSTITDTLVDMRVIYTKTALCATIFQNCRQLKTIRYIEFSPYADLRNTIFYNCDALENLTVGGTINSNNFDVHWSTKLSHDSLMSIINALADKSQDTSGTKWVCTLGTANLEKLTNEEIAIATEKGWTLA